MNGNVKLGRVAARSGEWAQHFSNASRFSTVYYVIIQTCLHNSWTSVVTSLEAVRSFRVVQKETTYLSVLNAVIILPSVHLSEAL